MRVIGLFILTLFMAAACATGPTQVESEARVAPDGAEKTAGLAFLQTKKAEDAKVGDSPAKYRGILLHAAYASHTINTDEWKADLLLPDGRLITVDALASDADELGRRAKNGDYVACNPDATGTVSLDEITILQTGAIPVS
jgi:hypothetical protein